MKGGQSKPLPQNKGGKHKGSMKKGGKKGGYKK